MSFRTERSAVRNLLSRSSDSVDPSLRYAQDDRAGRLAPPSRFGKGAGGLGLLLPHFPSVPDGNRTVVTASHEQSVAREMGFGDDAAEFA